MMEFDFVLKNSKRVFTFEFSRKLSELGFFAEKTKRRQLRFSPSSEAKQMILKTLEFTEGKHGFAGRPQKFVSLASVTSIYKRGTSRGQKSGKIEFVRLSQFVFRRSF